MPEQREYKHIQVDAPAEEDIVIQAGVKLPQSVSRDESEAPQVVSRDESEAPQTVIPSEGRSPEPRNPAATSQPSAKSEYHSTTLEDIQSSKMPKAQIITIAFALIAIAAFVIWYVVAH